MTIEAYVQGFGCMPDPTGYGDASLVLLPAPLDWGQGRHAGVALGPMAVLGASRFIETFDAELSIDPLDSGLATLDSLELVYDNEEAPLDLIEGRVRAIISDGKFPLCLGGERAIAVAMARAVEARKGDVGLVSLASGPGFADEHAGRRYTPETLGRRLVEEGPSVFYGARFWPSGDVSYLRDHQSIGFVAARTLEKNVEAIQESLDALPRRVHLSIDVSVLDPAFLPIAGNVDPGGLSWFRLIDIVDLVFSTRDVVSCDVCGFAPALGNVAPSLVVAQLVLRCLSRAAQRRAL